MRALCQFLDRTKYIFIYSLAKFNKGSMADTKGKLLKLKT